MRRRAPRPLSLAVEELARAIEPASTLALVQRAWPDAVGAAIAREATPVSERGGVVTVSCRSSVWAAELELMAPQIVERLGAILGPGRVGSLRLRADG